MDKLHLKGIIEFKPSVWRVISTQAVFLYPGSVTPAARRADCKSVTRETPKVRVLPGPLCAPVSQLKEESGLKPVKCEFKSLWEYLICLCSRIGICGGLRTLVGHRSM